MTRQQNMRLTAPRLVAASIRNLVHLAVVGGLIAGGVLISTSASAEDGGQYSPYRGNSANRN